MVTNQPPHVVAVIGQSRRHFGRQANVGSNKHEGHTFDRGGIVQQEHLVVLSFKTAKDVRVIVEFSQMLLCGVPIVQASVQAGVKWYHHSRTHSPRHVTSIDSALRTNTHDHTHNYVPKMTHHHNDAAPREDGHTVTLQQTHVIVN